MYWESLGWQISPCYSLHSLGVQFETYQPLISGIFQLFLDVKQITAIVYMGEPFYLQLWQNSTET